MAEQIVALALANREVLALLGHHFERAYPIDQTPCFGELLKAINEADERLSQQRREAQPESVPTVPAPSDAPEVPTD